MVLQISIISEGVFTRWGHIVLDSLSCIVKISGGVYVLHCTLCLFLVGFVCIVILYEYVCLRYMSTVTALCAQAINYIKYILYDTCQYMYVQLGSPTRLKLVFF